MEFTREDVREIAKQVADEVLVRLQKEQGELVYRDLIIGAIIGEGAIPIHGRENIKAPCTGCRLDPTKPLEAGNVMVTTKGAIGTLSPSEVRDWCSEIIELPNGRCQRARAIKEAARECKEKYPADTRKFFACYAPAFATITKG
jgi:hypothetical protein